MHWNCLGSCAWSEEQLEDEGFSDLVHTVKKGESKPKMTEQEMTGGQQFRTGPRTKPNPPVKSPSALETKKLTAIALGWLVEHVMNNFVYNFGGEDRRQKEGGPMGDELTEALSRFIANEYDEKFLEATKTNICADNIYLSNDFNSQDK